MKKMLPMSLAAVLVCLAPGVSWSVEENYACQVDRLVAHLACMETGVDAPTNVAGYPTEDFEFLVVICSDHEGKNHDIKVIQKDPTLVFKGTVKEQTDTQLVMEFNAAGGYHFRVQVKKEKQLIVYPPKLDIPFDSLTIAKTMDNRLEFSYGDTLVPNNVYVRGYQPVRQCWGFAETEAVPVEAE